MGIAKKKIIMIKDLYERAYPYYMQYCNITEKTPVKRREKWKHTSEKIWKKIGPEEIVILFKEITKEQIKQTILTEEWVEKHVAGMNRITEGILYFICLKDTDSDAKSTLEKFYYEMWYGAIIMAAKDFFCENMKEFLSEIYELSESYAPGFYEIPCEKIESWLNVLDPAKKYCKVNKELIMEPANSLLGIYFKYFSL